MAVTKQFRIDDDVPDNDPPAVEFDLVVAVPTDDPDNPGKKVEVAREEHFTGVPRSAVRRGALKEIAETGDDDDFFYLVVREEDHDRLDEVIPWMTVAQTKQLTDRLSEVYLRTPGKRPGR